MIFSVYSLSGKIETMATLDTVQDLLKLMEDFRCSAVKVMTKGDLGSDYDVIELQDK
jgi:hypothetical protein